MRSFRWWSLAVVLAACGGPEAVGDSGIDPSIDARVDPAGDAAIPDAALDSGVDDGDSDGVPSAMDCDDTDATVGASAERACTSACGGGMERCTTAVWAPCDAPTDCACATPGMMRLAPCARCGMQSERCNAEGRWEPASGCHDQGECEVAAVETRMTDRCGMEQRLCQATCTWGGWSASEPDGECRPGDREPCPPEIRFRGCQEDCRWGECS